MDIGTVAEQLNAHTCGELGREILAVEITAWDGMSLLTEQQRETVLCLSDLSFEIFLLCLYAQIVGLGTLQRTPATDWCWIFMISHVSLVSFSMSVTICSCLSSMSRV